MSQQEISTMNVVTIEIRKASSDNAITREHRYGYGSLGGSIDLRVSREHGIITVSWNVNRGRGWRARGWTSTFRGADAESRALAFATEQKWPQLVAWLEKLTPEQRDGAASAFSAQVATMMQ